MKLMQIIIGQSTIRQQQADILSIINEWYNDNDRINKWYNNNNINNTLESIDFN